MYTPHNGDTFPPQNQNLSVTIGNHPKRFCTKLHTEMVIHKTKKNDQSANRSATYHKVVNAATAHWH